MLSGRDEATTWICKGDKVIKTSHRRLAASGLGRRARRDGFYERIFARARDFLAHAGGCFGDSVDQGERVREMALGCGYDFDGIVKDLEGRDRVVKLSGLLVNKTNV